MGPLLDFVELSRDPLRKNAFLYELYEPREEMKWLRNTKWILLCGQVIAIEWCNQIPFGSSDICISKYPNQINQINTYVSDFQGIFLEETLWYQLPSVCWIYCQDPPSFFFVLKDKHFDQGVKKLQNSKQAGKFPASWLFELASPKQRAPAPTSLYQLWPQSLPNNPLGATLR